MRIRPIIIDHLQQTQSVKILISHTPRLHPTLKFKPERHLSLALILWRKKVLRMLKLQSLSYMPTPLESFIRMKYYQLFCLSIIHCSLHYVVALEKKPQRISQKIAALLIPQMQLSIVYKKCVLLLTLLSEEGCQAIYLHMLIASRGL